MEKANLHRTENFFSSFCIGIFLLTFLFGFIGANWQQIFIFASSKYDAGNPSIEGALTAYSNNLPIIFAKYILKVFNDPQVVSRIVSGLTMGFMGVTGFLVSFNFTRNSSISFIITLVAISCESLQYNGSTYDLYVNTGITNAEYGPLVPAFAFSLFGLKFWRTGFLMLGFLPSIHLIMGVVTIAMVLFSLIFIEEGRINLRKFWMFICPGVLIFLGQTFYYLYTNQKIPVTTTFQETNRFVLAFTDYAHYRSLGQFFVDTDSYVFLLFEVMITFLLIVFFKKKNNSEFKFSSGLFSCFFLLSILGSLFLGWLAIKPDTLIGSFAVRAMPLRFLANISSIAGFISLALFYELTKKINQVLFYLLILVLLISALYQSLTGYWFVSHIKVKYLHWGIALFCFACFHKKTEKYFGIIGQSITNVVTFFSRKVYPVKFSFVTSFILIFSIVSFGITRVAYEWRKDSKYWENWTNNEFWSNVHKNKGKLLFSSITPFNIQVISGKESIIWIHEITALPYVPYIGPYIEPKFVDIYGTNLISNGVFVFEAGAEKNTFTKRTHKEWIDLSNKYNFTGVIVPEEWKLNLNLLNSHKVSNNIWRNAQRNSNNLSYYIIR